MTLEKARELLAVQASMGSGYNRNSAKLILMEAGQEHDQSACPNLCWAGWSCYAGESLMITTAINRNPPGDSILTSPNYVPLKAESAQTSNLL